MCAHLSKLIIYKIKPERGLKIQNEKAFWKVQVTLQTGAEP